MDHMLLTVYLSAYGNGPQMTSSFVILLKQSKIVIAPLRQGFTIIWDGF